ncbi:MAG: farnesyl-diphosphate synthase [Gemmatimonadetes bacterium]|nr:farnesyl-diphosphate synthase [Gemmatimonadota bacterium]
MSYMDVESDLKTFLTVEKEKVEESLDSFSSWIQKRLPSRYSGPVCYSVMGEGKRLRPILCVLGYRATGGSLNSDMYDLASSIEVIHTYSLMHDDLPCMDDADLRRGRTTPHRVFGHEDVVKAAVLLIPSASLWALKALENFVLTDSIKRKIIKELNGASGAGGMVGGQYLDLLAESENLTPEDMQALHQKKTGALLRASLTIGALAANAEQDQLESLEAFGHWLGLAFQIKDDLLDATASTEDLGKQPSDRIHSKSTYVSLYGIERASQIALEMKDRALESICSAGLDDARFIKLADYVLERTK